MGIYQQYVNKTETEQLNRQITDISKTAKGITSDIKNFYPKEKEITKSPAISNKIKKEPKMQEYLQYPTADL
jgi:hypothetical protein